MPVFRPSEFFLSKDKNEVARKLKSEGKRAQIIAGGTGFYELAKRGYIPEVKSVVSIMQLGLSYIDENSNHVKIGATTTLQTLLDFGIGEKEGFEAMGDALHEIRPVQVRNVATIGGEVCISVPVVDLPTALLTCRATLKIIRENEEYETNLEDFYIDAFLTKLKYGELVKEVTLPKRSDGRLHSAFVKIGRTAYDFNLINCAVLLSSDPAGKLDSLSVYLGGVKRTPMHATEFEKKLLGKVPDERSISDAAQSSFSKSNFLPSVHGSNEYKHAILPVVLRDCIMKAYRRARRN
ncbi:MAG: FAD binding domain-containing protein [Nitrososphaerota archaeon]|nr:FAD binding domain-containing protein [Nitrososphaerota archaeon]